MAMKSFLLGVVLCVLFAGGMAFAQDQSFEVWRETFATQAQASGVLPQTLARVLPTLSFDESVIELDRKQPETQLTFAAYKQRIVSPARVQRGRQLKAEYASLLAQISKRYGVSPSMIIALWGMESSFGTSPGSYSILDSLASLAYEGRRASFFQNELIEALKIVQEEKMDPDLLEGSWAGAMGQCQFMPSTYRRYAVDFDGDGRRDIWDNDADALASIAHYLQAEGWKPGVRWGRAVKLVRPVPAAQIGLEVKHPLSFWHTHGVQLMSGKPLSLIGPTASLIQPDGPRGPSYLVYDNFRALMRWNRSTYFATSVGLLADQIEGGK